MVPNFIVGLSIISLFSLELFFQYQPWGIVAFFAFFASINTHCMSCREKMESMNALICLTGPIAILTSWFHPAITLLRIVTFYFYAQHFGFIQYFEGNRAIAFFENFWRFIVGLTMLLVEIPMLYKATKEEENNRD